MKLQGKFRAKGGPWGPGIFVLIRSAWLYGMCTILSGKLDGITVRSTEAQAQQRGSSFSFARNGECVEPIESLIIYVTVQMNNESYPIA